MPIPAVLLPVVGKVLGIIPPKVWLYGIIMCTIVCSSAFGGYTYRDKVALEELAAAQGEVITQVIVETKVVEKIVTEYIERDTAIEDSFNELEEDTENVQIVNCVDVGDEFISVFNDAARAASTN